MVEKVPSWLERLLLPKLSEISGDIKALNARIDSVEESVRSLRNEMLIRFDSLEKTMNARFEAVNTRFEAVNTRIDSLEKRMPVIEELTAIKIRLADLEKRVASVEA